MINENNRAWLMAAAAVYLLYTAYGLFQGRNDPETTMAPALAVLFAVLFSAAALALLIYAVRLWKRGRNEENEDRSRAEDENSLK